MGKNITSDQINFGQSQLRSISNEPTEILKALSESINMRLKDKQVPEEKTKSINISLQELSKTVEDVLLKS